MLKKLSLALSVLAALGFAVAAPANAKEFTKNAQGNKNVNVNKSVNVNKNVRVNKNVNVNKNVRVNRAVHQNYVVGRTYNGHIWYGHSRHFWHGTWYDYGVGPCWINVDGEWFWNILACPI
jgi:hypothetical protein